MGDCSNVKDERAGKKDTQKNDAPEASFFEYSL
jgi:hypothetical protein